jgi:ABC-type lipoprotein export system ATPase subunit
MDDALLGTVMERLDRVPLEDEIADLLLAACDGPETLDLALGGATVERPVDFSRPVTETGEPAGAYLRSVAVEGFRGIGPECTLPIEAGPGLTLVIGRNGSGKSSFAEGLEVLFTGNLRRWEGRSVVWRDSWRNLHHSTAKLEAEILVEDGGPTKVVRQWSEDQGLDDAKATVQIKGKKRGPLSELGWGEALEAYRPFLSHSELEAFFSGKPSDLYELLSSVLGLEEITTTTELLGKRRRALEGLASQAKKDLEGLLRRVQAVDDPRAVAVVAALSATPSKWDLDAAEAVVTGTSEAAAAGELGWLRQATQLTLPDAPTVTRVAEGLREAASAMEAQAGSEAGRSLELAELLDAALSHCEADDADCPVCGTTGVLDAAWRKSAEAKVEELRAAAAAARAARDAGVAAARAVRGLTAPAPAFLVNSPEGFDTTELRRLWGEWSGVAEGTDPAGLRAAADRIEVLHGELAGAASLMAKQAAVALNEREDRWAPVAGETAAWIVGARAAKAAAAPAARLKKAEAWMKEANDDLRNARLAPIAEQARNIWKQLRQASNVDLGEIRLAGSGNLRQLQIEVNVDGSQSAALGVMSQGEVNALALSIFIPRATLPDSPFRFLAIDDPVQAMDPAKVDGFARVLEEVAERRQVVVFTHDDRLPEAIRRLRIDARVLEVTRQSESVVEVRAVGDPADRALEDAAAVAATADLPHKVAARVVPGQCRLAVEAALVEGARRKLLGGGGRHRDVEDVLAKALTLNQKAALALHGDIDKGGDVFSRLNVLGKDLADTFRAVKEGAHKEHPGDLRDLISATRKLVHEIRIQTAG